MIPREAIEAAFAAVHNPLAEPSETERRKIEAQLVAALPFLVPQWRTMESAKKGDGVVLLGWGEYRERDGFSPAFMRWYDSVDGWSVNGLPFYPTHWQPLPESPASLRALESKT